MLDPFRQTFDTLSQRKIYSYFFRKEVGEIPVQRLKARLKALCSEKPVWKAISPIVLDEFFSRSFAIFSWVCLIRSLKVIPLSANLLVSVRLLMLICAPICMMLGMPLGRASRMSCSTSAATFMALISIPLVSSSTRSNRNLLILVSALAVLVSRSVRSCKS
jgi:hypothetical protein